jgi:anthranilate 1,2-dioxygenase small subunit
MSDDISQQIAQLQAEYSRCIDDGPLELWPELFTETCVYRITTAENYNAGLQVGVISASSRGMLRDRVSALREANIYERHSYRHVTGQPFLTSNGEGEATAETSFLIVRIMRQGASSIFATGRYVDRYRHEDDRLRFAERIVICDSTRFDTLVALPL